MLLGRIVETSVALAATAARGKKVALLGTTLRELAPDERAIGARYLAGEQPHKTGIGYGLVREVAAAVPAAGAATLELAEVDARLAAVVPLVGPGSAGARKDAFGALLARATAAEQQWLCELLVGGLRQGAEASMVVDAVAKATGVPVADVRRAHMLAGDVGAVAAAALADGAPGVARFGLTLFRPILPMLAQTADDAPAALATFGGEAAALELKLDGFRVQLHKDGDVVRAFSRGLNDVSQTVPEAIAAVRALPARRLVLDGEAIALFADGRPRPFQDTMARFGRRGDAAAGDPAATPLSLALFDALLVDDDTLLARPASERFGILGALAPGLAVPRLVTADADEAAAFYADAVGRGHEGVMAKALDAPYEAGSRGAAWLKIKRVHRLDLVVLAAEWGSGRRRGWLSNLWMGARDGDRFVMLGKTFKGMTDAVLAWQTAALLAREIDRDGHVVHVRPELVAEFAFNDVQRSSRYPGGVALRLARLVRYRDDKTAASADTLATVRALTPGTESKLSSLGTTDPE